VPATGWSFCRGQDSAAKFPAGLRHRTPRARPPVPLSLETIACDRVHSRVQSRESIGNRLAGRRRFCRHSYRLWDGARHGRDGQLREVGDLRKLRGGLPAPHRAAESAGVQSTSSPGRRSGRPSPASAAGTAGRVQSLSRETNGHVWNRGPIPRRAGRALHPPSRLIPQVRVLPLGTGPTADNTLRSWGRHNTQRGTLEVCTSDSRCPTLWRSSTGRSPRSATAGTPRARTICKSVGDSTRRWGRCHRGGVPKGTAQTWIVLYKHTGDVHGGK